MSKQRPIRVMIVDDHPIVRDGLKNMLLVFDDLMLVGEAESGDAALLSYPRYRPDVVLMDILMPEMDGIQTTRRLLKQHPDARVIMLTSYPDDDKVRAALEAGARGYILKKATIDELAGAIRTANAGQAALAPEATESLIRARTTPQMLGDDLSDREREVLGLITQGLTNDEIAEKLVISPATARHHVSACIQKLGASNRAHAASLAVRHNLVF